MRETVYSMLLEDQKAEMHLKVARYLETNVIVHLSDSLQV